jgi:hypothetical protein
VKVEARAGGDTQLLVELLASAHFWLGILE